MNANTLIIYIMVFFVLVGAADRIFGSRLGLGSKFEEGIMAMGTLTISTAGLLVLAPLIGDVVRPAVVPIFRAVGADPAMFGGLILGLDIGGAPLAKELAGSSDGYALALLTASMLGATISFTIPVGMNIAKKEYQPFVAKGILLGIITIPLGVLAGGLAAGAGGFAILHNILPVVVLSLLIILCLAKWERAIVSVFIWLGKIILGISIAGIGIGVIDGFTAWSPLPGITPLSDALVIIGNVAMILAGAFVLVEVLSRLLRRPLARIGSLLGIGDLAVTGLLVSLANNIPIFSSLPDMTERGRIVAVAFSVSGAFVFGDHLGFMAGYAPDMVAAMVIAKLTGGITAALLALLVTGRR